MSAELLVSQQVSWWSVHEYIQPWLEVAGPYPMAGTPAWCELSDDDPRRWAALLDAAQHWSLRMETCQQARADASRDVAAQGDWSSVAHRINNGRGPAYIPRQKRTTVR